MADENESSQPTGPTLTDSPGSAFADAPGSGYADVPGSGYADVASGSGYANSPARASAPADSAPAQVASIDSVARAANRIAENVERVIEGKSQMIRLGLAVLLAEGHLLIEDVPGVGKTKFARALARSIDCTVRRIQFTPDLLPSDVTGVSIYSADTRDFEFKPGPVFANLVVGDEINRASPKTQSALLESMEERQVSVDGETFPLESPFMVLATQNPIDMEGTYPLPEAQLDRFMARLSVGYPDRAAEVEMLSEQDELDPLDRLQPVSDAAEIRALIATARRVYVADAIKAYVVDLANATRTSPEVRLGASPRAVLQLVRAAKAWAALEERDYVVPDDIQLLVHPVLAHRIIVTGETQVARRGPSQVLTDIVARTPVPASAGANGRVGPGLSPIGRHGAAHAGS